MACGPGSLWTGEWTYTEGPKNGRTEAAGFPSVQVILDLWAALGRDMLVTPFELFVLTGVQRWADVMQAWGATGTLNQDGAQFARLARDAATAAAHTATSAAVNTGVGIAAASATAVNPIAGAVVGVVGAAISALNELLFILGAAAVGGWKCPPPLLRTMAGGACDFSAILGASGQGSTNVATAVARLSNYAASSAAQAPLTTSSSPASSTQKVLLIGGGAALALALGYYLWQR
jgi:hypothetical protein